jgi:hypothetical protein
MEELLIENYFNYETSKVKVKVLKDHAQVTFLGNVYGPFAKDKEIELPRALARILASEGITEYPHPQITFDDIRKRHHQERLAKNELKKLEEDFYLQAKDLIFLAEKKIINENPKEIKQLINEICLVRLEKMMRGILYVEDFNKISQLLTYEERYLFSSLREIIRTWLDDVLNNAILRKV